MTTDRRAQRLLEELEERRVTRQRLKFEADGRGDHLLATVHSVAEDAYADAFRMVAAALPTIVAETAESWAPGELAEMWGR